MNRNLIRGRENDRYGLQGTVSNEEEIYTALKVLKTGKVSGINDIPAEFLKVIEGDVLEKIVELCMEIYNAGVWPEISLMQ